MDQGTSGAAGRGGDEVVVVCIYISPVEVSDRTVEVVEIVKIGKDSGGWRQTGDKAVGINKSTGQLGLVIFQKLGV